MTIYPYEDWAHLAGRKVEIHLGGEYVCTGIVDAVMPDASMLWLVADHRESRRLFDSADGYEVRFNPLDQPVLRRATTEPIESVKNNAQSDVVDLTEGTV